MPLRSAIECNLILKSVGGGDVIRGIRNGSRLYLLCSRRSVAVRVENTLALQQPVKADSSNSASLLYGGWPAYEFGDGSSAATAILRKANGDRACACGREARRHAERFS